MNKDSKHPSEDNENMLDTEVRRRVLRNLLGLPAVATLAPGAALAQSNLNCRLTPPTDATVNSPAVTLPEADNVTSFFCVDENDPLLTSGTSAVPSDPRLTGLFDRGPGTALRELHPSTTPTPRQVCVVYVDEAGNISFQSGTTLNNGDAVAVTATCFVSFA